MAKTFITISGQLHTPWVLTCPGDKKRKSTDSFANLTTRNISNFLAADTIETNVNQILVGDRDIAVNGKQAVSGVVRVNDPGVVSWAGVIHGPNAGNVALVGGSAHQVTSKGLRDLLQCTGTATNNRLLIP